jgi:hypothetical protein
VVVQFLRYYIRPSYGPSWSWEVVTQDGEVIADGVADDDVQARALALVAGLKCMMPEREERLKSLN